MREQGSEGRRDGGTEGRCVNRYTIICGRLSVPTCVRLYPPDHDEALEQRLLTEIAGPDRGAGGGAGVEFACVTLIASYSDTEKGVCLEGGDVVEVLDDENPNMWLVRQKADRSKVGGLSDLIGC